MAQNIPPLPPQMPSNTHPINPLLAETLPTKPYSSLSSPVCVFWSCDRYLTHPINTLLVEKYNNNIIFRTDMFHHPHTMLWDIKTGVVKNTDTIGKDEGQNERKTVAALICKERGTLQAGKEVVSGLREEAVDMRKKYGCGIVGVFDYDGMVIFDFEVKGGEPWILVVEPEHFRRTWCEMLEAACVVAGLGGNGD